MKFDNGGKYNSNEFNEYCLKFGIKRKFTMPYKPQQNDDVKTKNYLALPLQCCHMFLYLKFFWPELY